MNSSNEYLERLGNLEILMKVGKMISKKEVRAFKVVRGKITPTEDLQEGRVYILQDSATQKHYIFRANSSGGMFTEDGDQTIYSNWSINGINPKYSKANLSKLLTEYDSLVSDLMIVSKLSSSQDTHWRAGSEMDYVESEDNSSNREGNKDELFEKILQ